MEVHISTQINITNIETVKFYALFADTMVMSRELSISQIKKICKQIEKEQIKGPSGNLVEIEILDMERFVWLFLGNVISVFILIILLQTEVLVNKIVEKNIPL
jgi:hypothetical protein